MLQKADSVEDLDVLDGNARSQVLANLVGTKVKGWKVMEAHPYGPDHSGGFFSRGFVVEQAGVTAFMKVLDMQGALQDDDPQTLIKLTRAHDFETLVLTFCTKEGLANVVKLLESGKAHAVLDGQKHNIFYLVMERGDEDVRARLETGFAGGFAWRLFALHQTAVGLAQLHWKAISHLDIKPSNVVEFREAGCIKLCDLGSAVSRRHPGPGDSIDYPGDERYAPPECIYGFVPQDAIDQRQGTDAYLLGSMIAFLVMGLGATNLLIDDTPDEAVPLVDGPAVRFSDALPFLVRAHGRITGRIRQAAPEYCANELADAYWQLCHPDPELRGHPDARKSAGRLPGIDRYISLFARLKIKAELAERKAG
ncbi:serine/threonine protein kinase [Paraburkholderia sp. RAU6.4a]|uniref:protein kinase domain-containing protein n=1 Tax=Paraburkholderia sp. RAU6.4a TaxID=2991067 RepID=UPI003D1AF0BB